MWCQKLHRATNRTEDVAKKGAGKWLLEYGIHMKLVSLKLPLRRV
jgi:hypothetical protein